MAIETAVMEQLLTSLLKAQQQQSKEQAAAFAKLAKASGLDPKVINNAQAKLKQLGDSAEEAAKSTSKMNKAGSMIGAAIADLTSGVMSTAGNLVNFGMSAMSGSAKVSDFVAAFKDLPIIGTVAGLFASLVKLQEDALDSFSALSASGINLGGSLTRLRLDAGSMGLTLEQMTKILKENSETLVQMGGTASSGARNFREISKAMGSGGFRQQLLNLGFTFEETNQVIGQYVKVVGGLTRDQAKDYKSVAAAATAYGKELDFLARITGESREAAQKKLEEEAAEANWQAFLASKDEETRKKLTDGLNKSMAGAGKAGADIFKAAAQGIAVQGEAGQITTSLMSEMSETIRKNAQAANDRTISAQNFMSGQTRFLATVQAQSAQGYQRNASVIQALTLSGDALGAQMGVHAKNYQTLTNAQNGQTISIEENVKRLEAERRKADEAARKADEEAAVMRKFQQAIKDVGLQMMTAFTPLITQVILPLVSRILPKMPGIIEGLNSFIKDMFDENKRGETFKKLMDDIGKLLLDLLSAAFVAMGQKLFNQREDAGKFQNFLNAVNTINPMAHLLEAMGVPVFGPKPATPGQQQSPAVQQIPGRSAGSWGTVGSAFENFGNRTTIEAHGTQGVFTPEQINHLMAQGTSNTLSAMVSQLNNSQAEMNSILREIADYGRKNVEATNSLSGNAFA